MSKYDEMVFRYHEFLKEMYIDCQYIEPINIRDLSHKHGISHSVSGACIKLGIYQPVHLNGKQLYGRYAWMTEEPSVDMAILLIDEMRKQKKVKKEQGYWHVRQYFFGLFTCRKWISLN